MEKQNEEQLQANCFQWFWNNYPALRRTMFAVPNGGKRPQDIGASGKLYSREANRLKATGVVPGVSDLIWVLRNRVIFIEMKTAVGTQSEEQKDFETKVKALGHSYVILRTVDQFKQFVKDNM